MALSITGDQVDKVLRHLLLKNGYKLKNKPRKKGETGADIIAEKYGVKVAIECIGFQENPPLRSKQFFEAFFRAISRISDGAKQCVMALPKRFDRGMDRRAKQYGEAWTRIGEAFPELEIWLVDVEKKRYERRLWSYWSTKEKPVSGKWAPREGTIGNLVLRCLEVNPQVSYEKVRRKVLLRFPQSKFNKQHFSWYKSKFKKNIT